MSDTNFDTDSALTAFQARKALLEVAQSEALKEEYSLVSEACTPEDLQYIDRTRVAASVRRRPFGL